MTAVAIIQARLSSQRLPGKVLADLAGRPVLAWVVRAAAAIPGIERVVVATSDRASDDPVAAWCAAAGVACARGSESDVLDRYAQAARAAGASIVMRLTADCPLLDPQVCGDVLRLLRESAADLASNCDPATWPDGLDCEVFTAAALEAAAREAVRPAEREHVTPFLYANRARFRLRSLVCPIPGLAGERWTLDTAADLAFLRAVAQHLPADRPPNLHEVMDVLRGAPGLRALNATAGAVRRLGLGTVQFGFDYGVTNRRGKVGEDEARAILSLARASGLAVLDTANQYGESERVLGHLSELAASFRIVTKTPALRSDRIDAADLAAVRAAIDESCRRLRRDRLDALLVHDAGALLLPGADRLAALLDDAKSSGKVERIGVSVQDPDLLRAVLDRVALDLVQLPLNLLDQRFAQSGLLQILGERSVEVHVRSVFLQGVLLHDPDALPPAVQHARAAVARVRDFAAAHGLSPIAACLGGALAQAAVSCVLVGVTGADELDAILAAARSLPDRLPDFAPLAVADPDIVIPGRWQVPTIRWGIAP